MVEAIEVAKIVGFILGPAGAAWLSVRATLNGTVTRVQRIETDVTAIRADVTHVRERVARLEGPR